MKKNNLLTQVSFPGLFLIILFFLLAAGCNKNQNILNKQEVSAKQLDGLGWGYGLDKQALTSFSQINLVANNGDYGATLIDPTLINGWGIAFSATGTPWVSSQGGHVSDVYNSEGTATVLGPVNIPSPGGPTGGNPTGVIFNPVGTDFVIPSANAQPATGARFIFVGVDGIVSGWNGTRGVNAFAQFNHVATSAYTGLAIAANGGSNFLYAADFRAGKIAVWDKTWAPVSMLFQDPSLPAGYSPFNIQTIGNELYVAYAKVGPDGRSQAGKGDGIISIFNPDGSFVKRFASGDKLNAPWGIAMAPASFFPQDAKNDGHPNPAILIGNFGDGHINAYSIDGKFLGQLKSGKDPIVIEGLWAITFPPATSTINPGRLYFAAGPKGETDGLFGYLIKE